MNSHGLCLNCNTPLAGRYCVECGQAADTSIPTIGEFISDFLNGLYSLDSRVWVSLRTLVLRPGVLTIEYIQGKRAAYITPFKLYLVFSVLYFLLSAWLSEDINLVSSGDDTAAMEAECVAGFTRILGPSPGQRYQQVCNNIIGNSSGFEQLLTERMPTLLFLSVPLMAALMVPLYWRRRVRYVEHLVFLFHMNANLFFWFSLLVLIGTFVHENLLALPTLAAITVVPWLSLRNVYGQSRLKTFLKFMILLVGYSLVLGTGMLVMTLFTALTL